MKKFILLLLLGFLAPAVHAQTVRNAASCSYTDVQAAYNLAVAGDTVQLPSCPNTTPSVGCPGTGNTWGCNTQGQNQVLNVNIGIFIKGQGNGQTVLIDNNWKGATGGNPLMYLQWTSNAPGGISGIKIITASNDAGATTAHIAVQTNSHAFRMNNMEFDSDEYAGGTCGNPSSQGAQFDGDIWGVVDHNLFQTCRLKGTFVFGTYWGTTVNTMVLNNGDVSWAKAESMGMPGFPANNFNTATGTCGGFGPVPCQAALVFEDNTYNQDVNNTGSNSLACEQSARCVNRFSSLTSNGTHGYEQVAQGQRSWEQYGNTFSSSKTTAFGSSCSGGNPANCNNIQALDVRSGLAMLFENQIVPTGVYTYSSSMVAQEYYRCNNCTSDPGTQAAPWGEQCTGTAAFSNNASWDYAPGGLNGPCIGSIGRGQESAQINRTGCASGTPACTAAAWPNNKLLGNYSWKNNNNGTVDPAISTGVSQGSPIQFQLNLDYYNGVGGVGLGTSGVGYGTLAQIPSNCSMSALSQDGQQTGAGYWATDQGNWNHSGKTFWDGTSQGILYKCYTTALKPAGATCQLAAGNGNWWCQFYEPFTYPHPLVGGSGTAATPVCIPGGGTFQRWQSVSCSDSSSGVVMCYTTDGTTPVTNQGTLCTHGTAYINSGATQPIIISQTGNSPLTTTMKVVAGRTGFTDSAVLSNTYVIQGDQYGGRLDILCATTTAYFHLEKIGSRWWFCTPQGHGFISMNVANVLTNGPGAVPDCAGVNTVPIYTAKYGDATFNWSWQTLKRATQWAFNTLGQDSTGDVLPGATCTFGTANCNWPGGKQPIRLPYVTESKPAENASINANNFISEPIKDEIVGTNAHYTSFRGGATYDVFDPKLGQWWNAALATNTALKTNDPFLVGIFTDDSDYFWGSGASPDYVTGHTPANIAWTTLITSPVQTYVQGTSFATKKVLYQITQNYTKTQALNPVTTCSIAAPCSLRDYLKQKYVTIAALNTAWGSSYTTFDSTATQVTSEAFATGDGTTTVFTHTFANGTIDPFSVLFFVGGTAQMGDCPWFHAGVSGGSCPTVAANTGTLGSPTANLITQASSTINYTTGAVTITFVTAPASGAAITVNYQFGGWMQGGTGLMDEDGTNTAWVGTNPACLEGANPSYPTYFSCIGGGGNNNPVPNANANLGADLDNWVSQMAAQYFKTMQTDLRAVSHIPYLGLDLVGAWSAPAYSKFLQGTAPYVDALMTDMHWFLPLPSPTVFQNMYQYNTQYLGDVPIINYGNGGEAQSDSGYSCFAGDINTVASQPVRGQNYFNAANYLLTTPSFNGDFPIVGFDHWSWQDFQNLNQGLVDVHDNAYDGIEAVTGSVACANYYTSLTNCGGEPAGFNAPYGNYVTPVTTANQLWLTISSSPVVTVNFSPTSAAFGSLPLYLNSPIIQVQVTNTGTSTLSISSVTTSGVFSLAAPMTAPDCRTVGTVAAGASCFFSVIATPAVAGPATGSVVLFDNAAGSPQAFPLTVTGVAVPPAPAVSFGGH